MRALVLALILLWPGLAWAQSAFVDPADLQLEVLVEDLPDTVYVGEMVMITIRGTYRRHITREALSQPDLAGFNWSQLGTDTWTDQRIDGRKVKVMQRRMALYPTRPGALRIAPFRHVLTLTDASDDWFEHTISSDPVEITVAPRPAEAEDAWWFPVRRLEVSDQWSNAPDRLEPGDGVLRIIRIEALGATPEMIPPMPQLTSPSAMIFAHPEKRLVELTPYGPVTYAFWRWTVRPTNQTSTILEPLVLPYFDTTTRRMAEARITPQRVAYLAKEARAATAEPTPDPAPQAAARLPGWAEALLGVVVFALGAGLLMRGRGFQIVLRPANLHRGLWSLRGAARRGDAQGTRRAMRALLAEHDAPAARAILAELDGGVFAPKRPPLDLPPLARGFAQAWVQDRKRAGTKTKSGVAVAPL